MGSDIILMGPILKTSCLLSLTVKSHSHPLFFPMKISFMANKKLHMIKVTQNIVRATRCVWTSFATLLRL